MSSRIPKFRASSLGIIKSKSRYKDQPDLNKTYRKSSLKNTNEDTEMPSEYESSFDHYEPTAGRRKRNITDVISPQPDFEVFRPKPGSSHSKSNQRDNPGKMRLHDENQLSRSKDGILVDKLVAENKILKLQMDEMNARLDRLKDDKDETIEAIQQENQELRNRLNAMKGRIDESKSSQNDLLKELDLQKKEKELIRLENLRAKPDKSAYEDGEGTISVHEENRKLKLEVEKQLKIMDRLETQNVILKHIGDKGEDSNQDVEKLKRKLEKKTNKLGEVNKELEQLKKSWLSPEKEMELKIRLRN